MLSCAELQTLYPKVMKVVTHKCTSTGNTNVQEWAGVRISDLLPLEDSSTVPWDPLVTFVGMDGFGYSLFRSRALQEDVILAYEQSGVALDVEQGGPLRLVKDGQHAKWV